MSATDQFPPTFVFQKDGQWQSTEPGGWALVIQGEQGRATFRVDDIFTKKEMEHHIDMTTAGPIWGANTLYYFTPIEGRMHYVIRTAWGRRIVFDVSQPKLRPTKGLDATLDAAERKRVKGVLEQAVEKYINVTEVGCCQGMFQVLAAVDVAGKTGLKETIPLLKELEKVNYVGGSVMGGWDVEEKLKAGDINPFSYDEYTLRQGVQTALRRLGAAPAGRPATGFQYLAEEKTDDGQTYLVAGRDYQAGSDHSARASRVDRILRGMKPVEVLGLIGPPDEVSSRAWIYDIDADKPYTLRVIWSGEARVDEIRRQIPPRWTVDVTNSQE